MDAPQIPAPIPFAAARAYGLNVTPREAPAARTAARAARVDDRVELTAHSPQAGAMRERVSGLVGAKVPGGVDFLASGSAPSSGALPMYRHPADKNAAATGVDLGRRLDLQG
ncbi:hypothetical protein PHYC_01138 [Phycisphaerales bacterium]|nr:hypothetical protein PHYC_01138 [Phycisphaerales bacterium]